jgi:Ni/Co efflux regulator RcnB
MAIVPALVIAAVAAAAAAKAASDKNKAIKSAKDEQRKVAAVQEKQVTAQADDERRKLLLRQERVRGATAVAAGATGVDLGDFSTLIHQSEVDAGLNLDTLDTNLGNSMESIRTSLDASLGSLNAQKQNIGLAALTGGIGGFSTGLSIGNSMTQAGIGQDQVDAAKKQQFGQYNSAINNFYQQTGV